MSIETLKILKRVFRWYAKEKDPDQKGGFEAEYKNQAYELVWNLDVSKNQKSILLYLIHKGRIIPDQRIRTRISLLKIAEKTGLSRATVQREITAMRESKLLRRTVKGRNPEKYGGSGRTVVSAYLVNLYRFM